MKHDNDIGILLQGSPITCLLIAAVAKIPIVFYYSDTQLLSKTDGIVLAGIINENYFIHYIKWNFAVSRFKSFFCIICREYNNNFTISYQFIIKEVRRILIM